MGSSEIPLLFLITPSPPSAAEHRVKAETERTGWLSARSVLSGVIASESQCESHYNLRWFS